MQTQTQTPRSLVAGGALTALSALMLCLSLILFTGFISQPHLTPTPGPARIVCVIEGQVVFDFTFDQVDTDAAGHITIVWLGQDSAPFVAPDLAECWKVPTTLGDKGN